MKFNVNQQVRCTTNGYQQLTKGKVYTVVGFHGNSDTNIKVLTDDNKVNWYNDANFNAIPISEQLLNVCKDMQDMYRFTSGKLASQLSNTLHDAMNVVKELEKPKPWQLPEIIKVVIEHVVDLHVDASLSDIDDEPQIYSGDVFTPMEKVNLRLYLYMRRWKKEFDNVKLDWSSRATKYYIYYNTHQNKYYVSNTYLMRIELVTYFSSNENANECLQWLKDIDLIK